LQAVILAGGLGTRQRPATEAIPKAMISVAGKPFLDHQLQLLRENGIDEIVLCVGYLGEVIEKHVGNGRAFGVDVLYSWDGPELLGPAGALKRASGLVQDRFFVTYGDAYLRAPYQRVMRTLSSVGKLGLMTVYRNEGRFGASDVETRGGLVTRYDKHATGKGLKWINFGLSAFRREALDVIPSGRPCGEEEFYGELIEKRQLAAFEVRERFFEIGTPASLAEFEKFVEGRQSRATSHRT